MTPRRGRKRRRLRNARLAGRLPTNIVTNQANPKASESPSRALKRSAPSVVVSLDPLAPIIVRSGRPLEGKSDADLARFPPPSTIAGCLRTAWARETAQPFGPELAQLAIAGPLLIDCNNRILAPKPADALYFGHGSLARCERAEPREFRSGCGSDLPDGLIPVQLINHVSEKPGDGPAWWSWTDLLNFRSGEQVTHAELRANGWCPPSGDRRTHITVDSKTGVVATGQFFQTEGLDFDAPRDSNRSSAGRMRLLAYSKKEIGSALAHLGGKRRLAELQPEPEDVWPSPPQGWMDRIASSGGICLTLLTPAIFCGGYRPGWLDSELIGSPPGIPELRLKLNAAAVKRWQPHSGWDLARRQPRPSRKLAEAGTTYWFRILGDAGRRALVALWLNNISDLEQDRRDGFGLVLPSPWKPPANPVF